ncbi:hypothetical protein ANANG_G00066050 [Anguilla anguilla]|uniref:Uncharacterized protein n=1 Tax=Anguilla anguilla TaxID=7936 RepID=A0A9D3MPR0_ANGAN|nr:hypothetical protein ANANG_G00066050 [Anguilla anguilla]
MLFSYIHKNSPLQVMPQHLNWIKFCRKQKPLQTQIMVCLGHLIQKKPCSSATHGSAKDTEGQGANANSGASDIDVCLFCFSCP